MSNDSHPGRRERADRRRNREVIVAAAREAFARADIAGETVSMNQVARAAGVGVATLYRHFPSRDELALAVYQRKLEEVTMRVRSRTQDRNAHASFRFWVAEFASFMLATRGMMDTLRAAGQSAAPFASPASDGVAEVVATFLADGTADRSMREELDAMDVTVAICALLATTGPGDSGARARRLLDLFIDSLAAQVE
ncbi:MULTISPECIES: TetR/AcrR family transcriptional regulator [Streptomyces]|uniref:Helix-turn-helix transcriptional regulator n=1 Tax=Streptomyces liliifuscus TaxID=2797636 RepID=A0A7T7KTG1_9ACTN|nr:TetR/AcrR family transcriptional regulator [Streptomyces liliifuscus]QQM38165.1 helix-turn-helix transcriptional regulator [Streptomyces liliifuscus]